MNNYKVKLGWSCFVFLLIHVNIITAQGERESQDITIDQCYDWAKSNYPLIVQIGIIEKVAQYNIDNAAKGILPQISFNGQATYQSDVTQIPFDLPNVDVPSLDRDQYKVYGELYQPLTHFGNVDVMKKQQEKNGELQIQKLEVDLYKIKERVNQLYFGILLIEEKINQYEIIINDIDTTLARINAAIEQGTATIADGQLLEVERISFEQKIIENRSNKTAYLNMLSSLTGRNITANSNLEIPVSIESEGVIKRPELQLFDLHSQSIDLQKKQIKKDLIPSLGLFAQGGYGRPALNFLSNSFDFYYIGGVKLNWNLSKLYSFKNKEKILDLSKERVKTDKETFLLNTSLTLSQQTAEIDKYSRLVEKDIAIIGLRQDILNTSKVQLDNGIITSSEYVNQLNNLSQARQMHTLHQIQLLSSKYNLKTTTGN